MRRKAVAKPSAGLTRKKPPGSVHKKLAGMLHRHVCVEPACRLVYEDACLVPERNGRCSTHRGTSRPIWESDRDPRSCCIGNVKQVTSSEALELYRLAGPGPWFQCSTCYRAHGWAVREGVSGV